MCCVPRIGRISERVLKCVVVLNSSSAVLLYRFIGFMAIKIHLLLFRAITFANLVPSAKGSLSKIRIYFHIQSCVFLFSSFQNYMF